MGLAVPYGEYAELVMFALWIGGEAQQSMSHFTQSEPTANEPGWYVDPTNAKLHRYWDGARWLTSDELAGRSPDVEPPATPTE